MKNHPIDKFNLTKTDYDNILTAIKNIYGQDADQQYDNPFPIPISNMI